MYTRVPIYIYCMSGCAVANSQAKLCHFLKPESLEKNQMYIFIKI